MKEEATKLLRDKNDVVVEFFNKPETITKLLKYILYIFLHYFLFLYWIFLHISTIQLEPEKLSDDQLEDIIGRMEFAKEGISLQLPTPSLILKYSFYKYIHY